jgi:hypothetical protein
VHHHDDDLDPDLQRAATAAHLLDTTVELCAKACELAARTGSAEWELHADFVAMCLAQPAQTRHLARDFMAVASRGARRRIGHDEHLTPDEFVRALELVGRFEARVLDGVPGIAAGRR